MGSQPDAGGIVAPFDVDSAFSFVFYTLHYRASFSAAMPNGISSSSRQDAAKHPFLNVMLCLRLNNWLVGLLGSDAVGRAFMLLFDAIQPWRNRCIWDADVCGCNCAVQKWKSKAHQMGATERGGGGGSLASTIGLLVVVGGIVAGGIFAMCKSEKEERRMQEARKKLVNRGRR